MKLGAFVPSYLLPGEDAHHGDQIRRFAVRAEELGFDSLWITDHLLTARRFYRVAWTEPLMTPSHVAAITSRVQLGTSVLVLPTHNPVVLAKEVATLQHLSGGRYIYGIGTGWYPPEFESNGRRPPAAARPPDRRGARSLDAADEGPQPDFPRQVPRLRGRHRRAAEPGAAGLGGRRPPVRPRGLPRREPDGPQGARQDLPLGRLDRPADLSARPDHDGHAGDRRGARAAGHVSRAEELRRRSRELLLAEREGRPRRGGRGTEEVHAGGRLGRASLGLHRSRLSDRNHR